MTKIEKLAHMSFVTACLVAIALMLEVRSSSRAMLSPPEAPRADLTGRIVSIPGLAWDQSRPTVVLQLSPTCHFCLESMDFYRRVADAAHVNAAGAPMVVITQGSLDDMKAKLLESHVTPDRVLSGSLDPAGVLTPTLYVVGPNGLVKHVFVGKLDPSREAEVLSLIRQSKS